MSINLLSIEPSEQPRHYAVCVAIGEQERTFIVQVTPLKGTNNGGSIVEINSAMLRFLHNEHDLNTPILRAVGQYDIGVELHFPILLDKFTV